MADSRQLALAKENTPLVLDGVGCVSDDQLKAVKTYLSKGGKAWLALPFGTHDEKGFKRATPLSEQLLKGKYKNLVVIDSATKVYFLLPGPLYQLALHNEQNDSQHYF